MHNVDKPEQFPEFEEKKSPRPAGGKFLRWVDWHFTRSPSSWSVLIYCALVGIAVSVCNIATPTERDCSGGKQCEHWLDIAAERLGWD